MWKHLINQLWFKIFLGFILFLVLVGWVPLLWHGQIKFSKSDFSTEYYKFMVDVLKIIFGFWLANIFYKRIQERDFSQRITQQWLAEKMVLLESIETIENIPNSMDIEIQDLILKIETCDSKLCFMAEQILSYSDKDRLGDIGNLIFEYKENLHRLMLRILSSLRKGEIILLRPLDSDMVEYITLIKGRLSN